MTTFLGKIYFGNGNNIGEIDSTETIVTTTKLSPGLPFNTYVADLDVTPDGNYLTILVSEALVGVGGEFIGSYSSGGATIASRSGVSRKLYWNGIDASFTAQEKYGGVSAYSNTSFSDKNYTLGYDTGGTAIYSGSLKEISLPAVQAPFPTATMSTSNMLTFATVEFDNTDDNSKAALFQYGQNDAETPSGLFRLLKQSAQVRQDVTAIPACLNVSNLVYYPSILAATDHIGGTSRIYYSTVESNDQAPAALLGKLWRFNLNPTGAGSILAGTYETQTQLFSKKVAIKEVRLYTEPLVTDNSFTIDLIGSGGSVMSGGSRIFTVGTNVTAGEDLVKWNPAIAPTYALGVSITNSSVLGNKSWTAKKLEIDIIDAGR